MIVGYFGYGGNAFLADQLRDELEDLGVTLRTCHEYPCADFAYNRETVNQFIDSCDVIILPQRVQRQPAKGTNRLAIAWSRAKPVIISPLPSYMEFAVEGENCLIANNPQEFITRIKELESSPKLRQKLGQKGQEAAFKFFHPRTHIKNFLEAMEGLEPKQKTEKASLWSIIIPHYLDSQQFLDLCLESIGESESAPQLEIIVVSSSSIKPTVPSNVKLHYSEIRLSFSEAINTGLRAASPESTHYLLLNDDTIVSKTAFAKMHEVMTKHNDNIVLNPYSNCDKGWLHNNTLMAGPVELIPGMDISQVSQVIGLIKNYDTGDNHVFNAPFCAMYATLIPKQILDKVGYLNSLFKNGGEDSDWSYRCQRFGFETKWCSAFIFHFGGKTRKFSESQDFASHHEEDNANNRLLKKRWKGKRVAIWTGPAFENWDLMSYKTTGIGGSETCAGRLAETFAQDGHHTTMYGTHEKKVQQSSVGADCTVDLVPWNEFRPEEEYFDLFVASRTLNCIDERLRAKKVVVHIHDIWLLSGKHISDFHYERVDHFICLSPWHRNFFIGHHEVPEKYQHKVIIVPNGVNIELFD